jgi:hypothetical protein
MLRAVFLIILGLFTTVQQTASIKPEDSALVKKLISETAGLDPVSRRTEYISERLLGRKYISHPLIGSAMDPEVLVTRMDGFDCVTFVETVLAIAHARSQDQFIKNLIAIRYRDGKVEWRNRLHYATDWAAYNCNRGLLDDVTFGPDSLVRDKTLNLVKGLDSHTAEYRYFPKNKFLKESLLLKSGDIIYFTSGRNGLDTNHMGLIIRKDGKLFLRNASLHNGAVMDEELAEYFRLNKMTGFIINRPK